MHDAAYSSIRILSYDGSQIYRSMHRIDGGEGLSTKDKFGRFNPKCFTGFLDVSLDTDEMKRIHSRSRAELGPFTISKEYTTAVINVKFDYTVKSYYNKSDQLYVRDGYDVEWDMLNDHVLLGEENGETVLLAIEVAKDEVDIEREDKKKKNKKPKSYPPVNEPVDESLLEGYFYYDEKKCKYFVKHKIDGNGRTKSESLIPVIKTKREIRDWIYQNGFDVDGVHYVRYKRSAGSGREGRCLFIKEPLYREMMEWSSCGLDADEVVDQASWQAYISLTLSSIEKKIHIPRQSILLIKDQKSVFEDEVIRVTADDEERLTASREKVKIENIIWDGEALLDVSVFEESGYSDKGMMLLRNRFFKTCAFNTNLQKWFCDNNITRLSQLNGYYSSNARSIKDIKLVITESSLKYLKFKPAGVDIGDWFEKWLDNVYVNKEESLFGVVKTEKASGILDDLLVRTNYQLINTLALTPYDAERVLKSSLDFLHNMQHDPMYVQYCPRLSAPTSHDPDEIYDESVMTESYRQKLINELVRLSDGFEGTLFYRNYRSDICESFKKKLKDGKILVDGANHTLFGNGLEFLRAVIDKGYTADEPLALKDGEIFSHKFDDGKHLLCERSPHITMGNLLVARNKYVPEIDTYFNLGKARTIVCVNAINSNIQHRLNGCDYDSDMMLITDEPTLLSVAIENYSRFPVPFCDVPTGAKRKYSTSPEDLAELDVQISENRIGEVVNLSQLMNSLYWEKLLCGESEEILNELYFDICKLAVLSGMEIDKAKRLYPVSSDKVLEDVGRHKLELYIDYGVGVPEFFEFVTKGKTTNNYHPKLNTAMSFVYDIVKNDRGRAPGDKTSNYTSLFDLEYDKRDPNGTYVKRREAIIKFIKAAQTRISGIQNRCRRAEREERLNAIKEVNDIFEKCQDEIAKRADDHLYALLLHELDLGERARKEVSASHSLLFASMCRANNGYLMSKLIPRKSEFRELVHFEGAEGYPDEFPCVLKLYGHAHVEADQDTKRRIRTLSKLDNTDF